MQKIVFLESLTKEYLLRTRQRRNTSSAWEYTKFIITCLLCVGLLGWYAYTVTSGSTIGYTLQQAERTYAQVVHHERITRTHLYDAQRNVYNTIAHRLDGMQWQPGSIPRYKLDISDIGVYNTRLGNDVVNQKVGYKTGEVLYR